MRQDPSNVQPRVVFRKAYYIKLGLGGSWEEDALRRGILRFGWGGQTIKDVRDGNWQRIREQLQQSSLTKGKATADYNRLRDIVLSTAEDLWVTFAGSKLWWGRVNGERPEQDEVSKYRRLVDGWHDRDLHNKLLVIDHLPGAIAALRGFRGTACSVKESDVLRRLLNSEPSSTHVALRDSRANLIEGVAEAIVSLHWADFEVLVDLVFRAGGWKRLSVLGKTQKLADLELQEPITGERYQVQVKGKAEKKEFLEYAAEFDRSAFRRLYFVVHTPSKQLAGLNYGNADIELVLPPRLAELVVDAGLVGWLMQKIW